jgi:HEAT repeat protein
MKSEHWLPRQGALYALGALGDVSVGPEVSAILGDADSPKGVALVAVATLARIGYREGAPTIRGFTKDQDIHVCLFASRALAELGEPVDREFLLSALHNDDYLVRQDACEALASVEGADIAEKLQLMVKNDSREAVRDAASQALLQRAIRDRTPTEKLAFLRSSLESADRHNALWIVQAILAQCGDEGRAFVGTLASEDSRLGERSLAFLLLSSNGPR